MMQNKINGKKAPLFSLKGAALRVRDRWILKETDWQVKPGENWAVIGPNGSGKTSLMKGLIGELSFVAGEVTRNLPVNRGIGYVSFDQTRRISELARKNEDKVDFSGNADYFTRVRDILFENGVPKDDVLHRIISLFSLNPFMERKITTLSAGEMRKVLIARALLKSPLLLILDEPFDGLDADSQKELKSLLNTLAQTVQMILITHRDDELIPAVTHVLLLKDLKVVSAGKKETVCLSDRLGSACMPPVIAAKNTAPTNGKVLVQMKNITVAYNGKTVLKNLDWTVKTGENWAVTGKNGAGKTTLLKLITADSLKAYANDITLFGMKRGEGESIWDIKKRIGFFSPDLQLRYQKKLTVLETVVSGFYDSVGLYRIPTSREMEKGKMLLSDLNFLNYKDRFFNHLSYGEQRIALIARALVKSPEIIILDEPCQGLDVDNRQRIIDFVDNIGRKGKAPVIFVTHRPEETPPCINRFLNL